MNLNEIYRDMKSATFHKRNQEIWDRVIREVEKADTETTGFPTLEISKLTYWEIYTAIKLAGKNRAYAFEAYTPENYGLSEYAKAQVFIVGE